MTAKKTAIEKDIDSYWRCPKCNAPAHGHGKTVSHVCDGEGSTCEGMICECELDTGPSHGKPEDPCPNATCYHCGWGGQLPSKAVVAQWKRDEAAKKIDPKTLTGWAKEAWTAGWRPPVGWKP